MTNITTLRGDIPEGSGLVNDVIVKMLKDLLAKAERGEIVAMGFFGVKPNRVIFSGWDGNTLGYNHEMNSAAAIVQYRMIRMHTPDEDNMQIE